MLRGTGSEHAASQGRLLSPSSSSPRTCGTERWERSAAKGWHSPAPTHAPCHRLPHPSPVLTRASRFPSSSDSRVTHPSGVGVGWGVVLAVCTAWSHSGIGKELMTRRYPLSSLKDALLARAERVSGECGEGGREEGEEGGGKERWRKEGEMEGRRR